MSSHIWRVLVKGEEVGVLWSARGGGYTLRAGRSLVQPVVHHFSPHEGLPGVEAYIVERFGAKAELVAAPSPQPPPLRGEGEHGPAP